MERLSNLKRVLVEVNKLSHKDYVALLAFCEKCDKKEDIYDLKLDDLEKIDEWFIREYLSNDKLHVLSDKFRKFVWDCD